MEGAWLSDKRGMAQTWFGSSCLAVYYIFRSYSLVSNLAVLSAASNSSGSTYCSLRGNTVLSIDR